MSITMRRGAGPRGRDQRASLALITSGAVLLALFLLKPLVAAITGTAVLYLFTFRIYRSIHRRILSPALASCTVLALTTFCMVIPVVLALRAVSTRAIQALEMVKRHTSMDGLASLFDSLPGVRSLLASLGGPDALTQIMQQVFGFTSDLVLSFLSSSVGALTQVLLMLFLLFFLLRDGEAAMQRVRDCLPFTPSEFRFLSNRMTRSFRATVFGRVAIALVQALLSWSIFAILRVPGSLLLANLTFVCALIPTFGAVLVWFPVMVWLMMLHAWTRALLLLLLGTFLVSTADNILYPVLVGSRARMHTAPMFLSILGGMWLFGISGIFLGPLIFTLAESLIAISLKRDQPEAVAGVRRAA
jgi:predicted PurR-regulated permease PerM